MIRWNAAVSAIVGTLLVPTAMHGQAESAGNPGAGGQARYLANGRQHTVRGPLRRHL